MNNGLLDLNMYGYDGSFGLFLWFMVVKCKYGFGFVLLLLVKSNDVYKIF